ncbi:hypothetical protein C8R46DRAFT_1117020 [Mycena filopes]|nr:hypothetical protein C8R46DRAFT_1117020 [Mycena filopes]
MDVKPKVRVKLEDWGPEMQEVKPKFEDVKPKVEDVKPKLEDDIQDVKPFKIEDVKPNIDNSRAHQLEVQRLKDELHLARTKIKELEENRGNRDSSRPGQVNVKQEVIDISDDDEVSASRARNVKIKQELIIEISDDDEGPVVSKDTFRRQSGHGQDAKPPKRERSVSPRPSPQTSDWRLTVPKRRKLEGDPEAKPRIKLEPDSSSAQDVALLAAADKAHGPGLPIPRFKEEYIDKFDRVPALADPTSDVRRSTMLKRRKLEEEPEENPKIKLGPALSSVPDAIVLAAEEKPHGGAHSPALAAIARFKKEYVDIPLARPSEHLDSSGATARLKRRHSESPPSVPSHSPTHVDPPEERNEVQATTGDVLMPLADDLMATASTHEFDNRGDQPALGSETEEGEILEDRDVILAPADVWG